MGDTIARLVCAELLAGYKVRIFEPVPSCNGGMPPSGHNRPTDLDIGRTTDHSGRPPPTSRLTS